MEVYLKTEITTSRKKDIGLDYKNFIRYIKSRAARQSNRAGKKLSVRNAY